MGLPDKTARAHYVSSKPPRTNQSYSQGVNEVAKKYGEQRPVINRGANDSLKGRHM